MSRKIVESVPNISEGQNKELIDEVVKAASSVAGCKVLDVDPGAATNRTVITIAGNPEAVMEASFRLIKKAGELIDMRNQTGEHPRHGATDVCPFVPVSGVTMEECAELARRLGKRVGEELGIPVYLYEKAASKPEWEKLPNIREGEYEALPEKLGKPEWKPDFGPNEWNENIARTGVCTIGARNFLIAYNVNLNTKDPGVARDIGLTIRDNGRFLRDSNWKFIRDENGNKTKQQGKLRYCKATGWYIEEYDTAQVTMNLTDISVTPLHMGFEAVKDEAEKLGVRVTGSEVVGLLPLEAMLDAGRFYIEKQNRGLSSTGRQGKTTGVPQRELIETAIKSMGLGDVAPFDPEEKIIEYMVAEKNVNLSGMTCRDFADVLSTDSPAPGGGSAAALMGALGASLDAMVANLTVKNRKCRSDWDLMREIAPEAQSLKDNLLNAIDDDTAAFNAWMDAARHGGDVQTAVKMAIEVPLRVLMQCPDIIKMALSLEEKGMQASVSDAGVAAAAARAAAVSAYYNVLINLGEIEDTKFAESTKKKAEEYLAKSLKSADSVFNQVREKLIQKMEDRNS
ncbi:MAG: glutamate formimidoyltransferase [Candidatus Aegiribacteria sp.]|nr:glutamate formimidoyltransferase [Candidatus Aegiribacteria sp.]